MSGAPPSFEAGRSPVESLLRLVDVAKHLGISRRTFERERSAGRFPAPDLKIGKAPLWRPGTVQTWIEEQSASTRMGGAR